MKFAIWKKFSPAARRAAATAAYGSDRVTADGCCPLGVALVADKVAHPMEMSGCTWTAPSEALVADALIDTVDDLDLAAALSAERALADMAAEFILAWDGGRIDPAALPELLEVDA